MASLPGYKQTSNLLMRANINKGIISPPNDSILTKTEKPLRRWPRGTPGRPGGEGVQIIYQNLARNGDFRQFRPDL